LLVVSPLPVLAQVPGAQGEGGDHPLFSRFADSVIVDYRHESDANYRLVLGNMRRLAGRVVAEREQRLRGALTRITYEIPQGLALADAGEYYREQAEQRGYSLLYRCSGRECGNSNYWANEVFNDRSLYGPERGQSYLVWRTESAGGDTAYLVLYLITRANRRQLAHLEILETGRPDQSVVVELSSASLLEAGALRLPGLLFDAQDRLSDDRGLEAAARLLQEAPALTVYLVAHLAEPGELETLLARSQRRAELVRTRLIALGVNGGRVVARGIGPLAPLCESGACAERVELVLQSPGNP